MIRAIIFDCFGVLVGRGFDETYRLAGGDPVKDAEFISDLLGQANLGTIDLQGMIYAVTQKLSITSSTWQSAVAKSEQINDELLEFIVDLKDTYKLGILSNANVGTLKRIFTDSQLNIFDTVVVSAEVHMVKPQAEIYELTAQNMGVLPSECVFIDDIKAYVDAANVTGMHGLLYKDFQLLKHDLNVVLSNS